MWDDSKNPTYKAPISSEEIWSEIRYLDPDTLHIQATSQPDQSDRMAIIAVLVAVVLICAVALAFYLRIWVFIPCFSNFWRHPGAGALSVLIRALKEQCQRIDTGSTVSLP